ncbi:MAG: efflux transporter periplasmic adaptor subunit [Gammaproteobacteria bacterium]|nr:MAG: efflux transporter periplasmic adaptor subunit [Gammaproteobacteria bacterium]
MTANKKTPLMKIIVIAIVSALVGGGIVMSLGDFSANSTTTASSKKAEKKPLYWVGPMDANYRRDKPGKSPMGMDLIPYYGDDGKGPDAGKGTIRVNPDVINNLGVRTATAKITNLHSRIDTVGYVAYNEDKLVHIHPRVQGWVEKLYVKAEGDMVTENQPLYDIYSPELVNAQEELIIALDRKNKRLISAAKNRLVALQIPQITIDKLLKNRQVQQRITFYAPQSGVIENLNIREGVFVKPGTTIMAIGDLSEVWIEAEVFERQASEVITGTPVTMTLDYLPGKTYAGKVDYIYPTLDAKTRTVKVRLRFDNKNGDFKPNMFAQVSIHTNGDAALLIPKEALIRTGNQDRVVLALGEGSFKSIAVTVGRYDNQNVEILSGLSAGEKVVSSAQFLLDSESSKSSDFKRMNHGAAETASNGNDMAGMDMSGDTSTQKIPSAMVNGTVISVMKDHRMVTIDRDAIAKWDKEAARVDFIVDESVDMSLFTPDTYLMFTFEIRDGDFVIVSSMPMSNNQDKGE